LRRCGRQQQVKPRVRRHSYGKKKVGRRAILRRGRLCGATFVGCILILTVSCLAVPLAATAQPPGKVYRIGYLATVPPPAHLWEALLDGLRERGYREGQNLVFYTRFLGGQ